MLRPRPTAESITPRRRSRPRSSLSTSLRATTLRSFSWRWWFLSWTHSRMKTVSIPVTISAHLYAAKLNFRFQSSTCMSTRCPTCSVCWVKTARKLKSLQGEGSHIIMQFPHRVTLQLSYLFSSPLIRLLFSAKEPEPVLVFEDVAMHGYGVSSEPLNIDGTKFVASKLAKFHAASLYLDRDVSMALK